MTKKLKPVVMWAVIQNDKIFSVSKLKVDALNDAKDYRTYIYGDPKARVIKVNVTPI